MKQRLKLGILYRSSISIPLLLLLSLSTLPAGNRNTYPLPEDRGTAGALAALQKLPVYTRVLHTIAHPDDESGGTLTWLSRKFHASAALFSLTRGEGGQNILGNEKYEALGLLRTGELLEASKHYGVELYFATVTDFGFSKNAEETLSKWGEEATLEEIVRFIRKWRPTIIISKFRGDSSDGHGHHQAAGILFRKAYRAAGDPQRFPEQIKQGLHPWQAKKLYVSGLRGSAEKGSWTVRIPVGEYDPVLGRSYSEIAIEGYSKHRSQGIGAAFSLPSNNYDYYQLVDSIVGIKPKEDGFFDSINTSLTAIAELAGNEKSTIPFLSDSLAAVERVALEALQAFQEAQPASSAVVASRGVVLLNETIQKIENSSLSKHSKEILKDALAEKLEDFQKAINTALGISLAATIDDATSVPGQKESVAVYFYNRGTEQVDLKRVSLHMQEGWKSSLPANVALGKLSPSDSAVFRFSVDIPLDAKVTQPFWYLEHRDDTRYKIRPTKDFFAAFGSPEIVAEAIYQFQDAEISIQKTVRAQAGDPLRGSDFIEFQVVPTISLTVKPDLSIAPIGSTFQSREFQVSITNNAENEARGTLKLVCGTGWEVNPPELHFDILRRGETFTANFTLQIPPGASPGDYPVEAFANKEGQEFSSGYQIVSYPENWTRNLYSPARSEIRIFDMKVAPGLTAGYIPGAGDEIPVALAQLGIKVQTLSASDLAFADLSGYQTIITGIRAYNVNADLRANNQRLLEYVRQGGTLIVQYCRPMSGPSFGSTGSPFPYGPYPMSNSNADRITVEDSPIKILQPENPIFNTPNKISQADFQGWVQERGLYFMNRWDSRYTALLSGNDPGEPPQNGGMLITPYGNGYYIYTAYAWFRQLPAGVPGAFRIFANLLSIGK